MLSAPVSARVLVVSFSFRPLGNPRAFRWSMLVDRIAAAGYEVDVVTSWVPGCPPVEVGSGIEVHRTGFRLVEGIRARLRTRRARAGTAAPGAAPPGLTARLGAAVAGLVLRLWRLLLWPDASCLWYWPARACVARLTRSREYDIIISVTPAFTGVLVGAFAKRLIPRAKWLLDIGDPFGFLEESPPNNLWLYAGLNRRVERRALRQAAWVSVTNESVRDRYATTFPKTADKIEVIPPLLSLDSSVRDAPGYLTPGRRNFVYVGTLYRGLREPTFLLDLLVLARGMGELQDVDLHFFGDVSASAAILMRFEPLLGRGLHVHGQVARDAVAGVMHGADLLINIGNNSLSQLPSKVVEYAATGRPVLNLAVTTADTSVRFFAGYSSALSLVHEGRSPAIAQVSALVRFLADVPSRLPQAAIDEFLAPYQPDSVVGRYLDILARLRAVGRR